MYRSAIKLLIISTLAGVLSFVALTFIYSAQEKSIIDITGDSKGYMMLAENLLDNHVFSVSSEPPFDPESFRSPGYPAFLALLFGLTNNWFLVLLVQVLLVSVAPVLLYLLVSPYHERAAWYSSLIFALEPTRLFTSANLLSDALFTCVFLCSLVLLEYARRKNTFLPFVGVGVVVGLSIWIRPIAVFLPIVFALYVWWSTSSWKRGIALGFLLIVVAYAAVFPWMLRNHAKFNSLGISSVGSANLMLYNAPTFATHLKDAEVSKKVADFRAEQTALPREDALSLARSDRFTDAFRDTISGHEFAYVLFHVGKTIPFFVTDGLREIARLSGVKGAPSFNITGALFHGDIGAIINYFKQGGISIVLLIIGSCFWALTTLLFFLGAFGSVIEGRNSKFVLFLAALVLYFALLTGPVSNARYRLPVSGLMIAIAATILIKPSMKVEGV